MKTARQLTCNAGNRCLISALAGMVIFILTMLCPPVQGQMIDGIVAVVDDKIILHSDLVKKMQELGAKEYEVQAARQVLQIMIEDVIVDKIYKTMGMPRIDIKQAEAVAKDMKLDIVSAQSIIKRNSLMEMMVKSRIVITQTMIMDYYEANKEFSGSDSIHLKQILIKNDKEKAEKAYSDLRKGAPFDEAAKTYSDILAGESPDIGWIAFKDMAGEAAAALKTAKKDDIVGPISIGENLLIFQVLETGVTGGRPIEEVREEIVEILQDKYRKEAFEHWLKMIMADHYIGIYL